MGFVGDIASRPGLRHSKTAGRRQRDARLSIKNSINRALFIYRHPIRKVNARLRPIREAFVYQRPTGEGLACQRPIREGHICHILRGALACRGACYQHLIREVFANAPYAECWQAPRTRGASKLPIH
ncbi:hypothetical protein COLSTE_01154 [Collinsella stercoris DSM 13279]|uniref:Uncharacterized protein n=1 Tax=Collinsella stercoris DSM 13279 TaxID=445975 RepID=B6GAQ4_9ACTN|nr:hypothetical protein COLSTE_01154 [Collinsella stercoris DSM 13279]